MSATVHDLTSRIRAQRPGCACRDDWTCYPHRLVDLSDQLHQQRDTAADELLIPINEHLDALDHALAVIDQIVTECRGRPRDRKDQTR